MPLIITNDYDSYLELSEETEEESDTKSASRDETDEVSQPPCYITLTKLLSQSSESESDEEKPKTQFRPVFVPK